MSSRARSRAGAASSQAASSQAASSSQAAPSSTATGGGRGTASRAGGLVGGLNPQQWRDKIISMSLKKKITTANCFLVEIEKAVEQASSDNNFREVTPVLTAVTEIYDKRVEATHADAMKARIGFLSTERSGGGHDGDGDTTLGGDGDGDEQGGERRRGRKKSGQQSYIEKNVNSLNMKKNELGQEFDPIFNAMTVGESGSTPLSAALLSQIRLHPGAILAMDSNDRYDDYYREQAAAHDLDAATLHLPVVADDDKNSIDHGSKDDKAGDNEAGNNEADDKAGDNEADDKAGDNEADDKAQSTTGSAPETAVKASDDNLYSPQQFAELGYLFPSAPLHFAKESLCQTYAGFQFSDWTHDQPAFVYPPTTERPAPMPPSPTPISLLAAPTTTAGDAPAAAEASPVHDEHDNQYNDNHYDNDHDDGDFDFDYIGGGGGDNDVEADNGELLGEAEAEPDYNQLLREESHQRQLMVGNMLSIMTSNVDIQKFDQRFAKNWAGPSHWRFFPTAAAGTGGGNKRREMEPDGDKGDDDDNNEAAGKPKARSRRSEPFRIDFTQPLDMKSFVRSEHINLSAASLAKANPADNLLPPDQRYSLRDLLSFFVRPEWRVQDLLAPAQQHHQQASLAHTLGVAVADVSFAAGGHVSFVEAAAGELAEQVGYHYPTAEEDVGPPDMDFFDDDNNDHYSGGGVNDGYSRDYNAAGSGVGGGPYGFNAQPVLPAQPDANLLAPRRLGLVALQSTLNVKKLKSEIWTELSGRLKDSAATQSVVVDDDDKEDAADKTKAERFQDILETIPTHIDAPEQLSQVSVPFCFICLLHLANEQGLELQQNPDDMLSTLSISRS